jgi:uncharacterized protein
MRIALISDTHGLLRPELFAHLEGVEGIVHAGDIGGAGLLAELGAFAPVTAVWGNTDGFDVRARVPEIALREWEGRSIVVVHGHRLGTPTPRRLAALHPDADLIVFGHTHRPEIREVAGVLAVNPGSCGHRRFDLEPTVVLARLAAPRIETELRTLDAPPG